MLPNSFNPTFIERKNRLIEQAMHSIHHAIAEAAMGNIALNINLQWTEVHHENGELKELSLCVDYEEVEPKASE